MSKTQNLYSFAECNHFIVPSFRNSDRSEIRRNRLQLRLLLFCCFFALPDISFSQEPIITKEEINNTEENIIIDRYLDLNIDIQEQLPPLQVLLEMAANNNPAVQFNDKLAQAYKSRIDVERKTWTSHINGFFNYGYGNQSLIASGSIESDFVNIANGYRTGINLNIPLYEFTTRKDRLRNRTFEYEAQLQKKDELSLEIHNRVVEEYHNLILGHKLMRLRFEMVEKARQSMNITEREYRIGNTDVTTYTRIMEIFTINSAQYELARKDFMMAYDKLELLIGVPLTRLVGMRDQEIGE